MDSQQIAAPNLSSVVIPLLKGVIYQEASPDLWNDLLNLQARVRDYVAVLGLRLILDEAEGYAFLRSIPDGDGGDPERAQLPRLINRRPLSFPVSLLLGLLRKKLAEFDANGGDTKLVLSREEIADLLRIFLQESSNESRLIDQIDSHINKITELGFLRQLRGNADVFEVRRILKAFVDAQWLSEFEERLAAYRAACVGANIKQDG